MENKISLNEAINKAIKIKKSGGIKPIRVGLSYSVEDPINRIMLKNIELIKKLNM